MAPLKVKPSIFSLILALELEVTYLKLLEAAQRHDRSGRPTSAQLSAPGSISVYKLIVLHKS